MMMIMLVKTMTMTATVQWSREWGLFPISQCVNGDGNNDENDNHDDDDANDNDEHHDVPEIKRHGSCHDHPDMCTAGSSCVNGDCVCDPDFNPESGSGLTCGELKLNGGELRA